MTSLLSRLLANNYLFHKKNYYENFTNSYRNGGGRKSKRVGEINFISNKLWKITIKQAYGCSNGPYANEKC